MRFMQSLDSGSVAFTLFMTVIIYCVFMVLLLLFFSETLVNVNFFMHICG